MFEPSIISTYIRRIKWPAGRIKNTVTSTNNYLALKTSHSSKEPASSSSKEADKTRQELTPSQYCVNGWMPFFCLYRSSNT